ncbi:MAG TPA: RNA polymerase sigma factor [Vicinamibacterales bacterium]|jgi:RNA polymerase sigma-70 factor (ECF subfamily)
MAALEHPSDDDLMVRIARGDRDAFALLYRRFRPDVFRFALHVSGSRSVADDVTQDVFMAVIHEGARYEAGRSSVRAWLLGITRNHVRRTRARRVDSSLDDDPSAAALSVDADPLPDLARREDLTALRRAVVQLPVKFREAIVLCDLQELSYVDAAAALGCALGTVRSRLHRGRALLARRLRTGRCSVRRQADVNGPLKPAATEE